MNEADVKRTMIKSVKAAGGYARRIEDQYAVGMVDTILIPRGLPVFMAEVKLVKSATFSPSPRQFVELELIEKAANEQGHVVPLVIGYKVDTKTYYFHPPQMFIRCTDCFSVTTSDMDFCAQLTQFHFSRRK